ncbi:penicillin-binding protein 2 [uncultured Limnohabitans sp.]|jgi:penicillin-binding protein 2|uniref:penicillin-binding protein 2 n=1 Tax=uncultured Limnohabitans sp. TaxID=768543 RepID=UPI002630C813|nr:penicillin-binding protein 2 [uncultured Limnohabitans sp.]
MSWNMPSLSELRDIRAEIDRFQGRVVVIQWVVLLCFLLLAARLIHLQVIRYDDLMAQAENNRTAILPTVPPRGNILDRNGLVLANNYSAYTLEITPSKVQDLEVTIDELAELVDIQIKDRRRFKRLREESKSFDSLPIRNRLTDEEVARFSAQSYRFPGVEIKARLFRQYPYGELASHVIGYIGRINQRDKERLEENDDTANYRGTEYIGKLGVEQRYERELHGVTGINQIETSAGGQAIRSLFNRPAVPGQNVVLSIDIQLQKMVEDLFGKRRGALVALDPKTGAVLAFVSKPTFDPNWFVDGIDVENWQMLNESIDKPLLNRALRGTYPPGSTYKPFMALAALTTGKRKASTTVNDTGSWTYGGHTFRSHGDVGLGSVDMVTSIVKSSNVYYYELANDMGVDSIHDFMKPLGFGQITGIDLPGEVRGILPSTDWKRSYFKRPEQKKWFGGETISLGIGQGYNTFTMLQLASATATIANGGVQFKPHVVTATQEALSHIQAQVHTSEPLDLGYKREHIDVVRKGLEGVVTAGTSQRVFADAPYTSAGKTGTAQAVTIGQKEKYDAAKMSEYQRDHALYMAYAPADNPQIALAVVVENAGFGAAAAAPIARRVFDYWLLGQYPSEADMLATQKGMTSVPMGQPRSKKDVPLIGPKPEPSGKSEGR